jgi:hypothetical protein
MEMAKVMYTAVDGRLVFKKAAGFVKGSGCFKCISCGKNTRMTDDPDAASMKMCGRCYQMGGDDNSVADGYMPEEVFFNLYGEHSSWYKEQVEKNTAYVDGIV